MQAIEPLLVTDKLIPRKAKKIPSLPNLHVAQSPCWVSSLANSAFSSQVSAKFVLVAICCRGHRSEVMDRQDRAVCVTFGMGHTARSNNRTLKAADDSHGTLQSARRQQDYLSQYAIERRYVDEPPAENPVCARMPGAIYG